MSARNLSKINYAARICDRICRGMTMEFDEVITGRRAVREYTAQAVDERAIRNLIDAAVTHRAQ